MCHGDANAFDAKVVHALTGKATVSGVTFQDVAGDLVVSYNLKVDGQNATDFLVLRTDYKLSGGIRSDAGANAPAGGTNGNYTITIPGGVAAAGAGSRYFLRVSNGTSNSGVHAIVSGDFPAAAYADVVSDQSCVDCHGAGGVAPHPTFGYPAMVASQCVICHEGVTDGTAPPYENFFPASYTGFVSLIHGIHNSHNMPDGHYVFREGEEPFSVTYPTYMTNCSVCHRDEDVAAANSMTVSGENCFTCHGSMESWDFAEAGLAFHESYTEATNCAVCHDGDTAPATVTGFHDGLETERVGLIWKGEDLSVKEGKLFTWTIDSIVDNGTNLTIKWSATYKGDPVDPCNSTITSTAPGFFNVPQPDGSLGFRRSYAQGDDFILGKSTSAPGQPNNAAVTTTNTTCASNVATTTIPVESMPAGSRGLLVLEGKPQLPLPAGAEKGKAPYYEFDYLYVRVPSPTREWVVGTGALPTEPRRDVVDTEKCLKCHVGSLYQHGNSRVDNTKLCVICHNPASSEQNIRFGMGVTASEAYDGKPGQTYELKTMLHAIHSAGETKAPIVIYRNRGIYAWGGSEDQLPNWKAGDPCDAPESVIEGPDLLGNIVFGSDPASNNKCQLHTFHTPTYPRELNDCAACHVDTFDVLPDQRKAVATTLDAGGTTWSNQVDDVLEGASAAACMSCHQSADSFGQAVLKGHAYQNGWEPKAFPNGRQTIIDAAN